MVYIRKESYPRGVVINSVTLSKWLSSLGPWLFHIQNEGAGSDSL